MTHHPPAPAAGGRRRAPPTPRMEPPRALGLFGGGRRQRPVDRKRLRTFAGGTVAFGPGAGPAREPGGAIPASREPQVPAGEPIGGGRRSRRDGRGRASLGRERPRRLPPWG